jgi:hypothetical protein
MSTIEHAIVKLLIEHGLNVAFNKCYMRLCHSIYSVTSDGYQGLAVGHKLISDGLLWRTSDITLF